MVLVFSVFTCNESGTIIFGIRGFGLFSKDSSLLEENKEDIESAALFLWRYLVDFDLLKI